MQKSSVQQVNITKYKQHVLSNVDDLVAVEEPLEIRIGFGEVNQREQKRIAVTMRTPGHDFELALGFLLTEGIINYVDDVYKIAYCTSLQTEKNHNNVVRVELHPHVTLDWSRLQRNFYTTSSCGVCGKESIEAIKTSCMVIAAETVKCTLHTCISLPDLVKNYQTIFTVTGGIHACALFSTEGQLILLREDVGRHNALDKLIGAANAMSKNPLGQSILLLSGRASFELIQKAAMAGIPIVCAVGAPSSLAIETAFAFNITLLGFVRNQQANIYTHAYRII